MTDSILKKLVGSRFNVVGSGRYLKTLEHDSLVIDTEKDYFYWNSKGIRGTPLDWLVKIENFPLNTAKEILNSLLFAVTEYDLKEEKAEENQSFDLNEDIVEYFYENGLTNREYWYKRKFTDRIIEEFKLGYYNGWYTIPIYVDGKLRNISMRRDFPRKAVKSFKKGVGPLPFNFDIIKHFSKIYFVEGPTDVISMVQNGLPAVCTNSGTHFFDDSWLHYFINVKTIFILFDNDEAGISGARYMANKLGIYKCKIYCFWNFGDKYDPNDFFVDGHTAQELKDLVNKEFKYAFEI